MFFKHPSTDGGIEPARQEEVSGAQEEGGDAHGIDADDGPEGRCIAEVFGNDTSQEDTQSHTHVPGDEDGGIGGAPLVVGCHVDGHVLEGRPHVSVA